jgi:hypothetical protein
MREVLECSLVVGRSDLRRFPAHLPALSTKQLLKGSPARIEAEFANARQSQRIRMGTDPFVEPGARPRAGSALQRQPPPFFPSKQTFVSASGTSAMCQKTYVG